MIGIKVQNFVWEKALLALLKGKAEIWQEGKVYQAVLVHFSRNELRLFKKKEKAPIMTLGNSISLPFKYHQLMQCLNNIPDTYENATFIWNKTQRCLKNKKTKKQIALTEKENDVIAFLKKAPHRTATKNDLLQHVWQYTSDADTHTVETTVFSLRQKVAPISDALITSDKNGYHLT